MKRYKIGNKIITADSATQAVKIAKLIDNKAAFKDEASPIDTVNSLVQEELSAIDSYNVAIKNLEGKIPEESLAAIKAIRDDEQTHVQNLYAVINGNVTAKNLEDSVNDDRLDIVKLLQRATEFANNDNYQAVANICANIISTLKFMREAK